MEKNIVELKEYADKKKAVADKIKPEVKEHRPGIKKATGKGFRLIHDGKRVLHMFEGDPFTETTSRNEIFVGTEWQCRNEIKRLKLKELK